MMKQPKYSNLETYKLLVFDLYLQAQKNGGYITAHDVRSCCSSYKLDTHFVGKGLRKIEVLIPEPVAKSKKLRLRWAAEVPNDDMIKRLFDEVYLMRHIETERIRRERKEKKALMQAQVSRHLFDADAVEVPVEVQVDPSEDAWCLKFPDEKQYFSAFGLEVMRKIGRMFCIESIKNELDGQ